MTRFPSGTTSFPRGEIASLVIIDAVYRLREGVIKARSLEEESFSDGFLLEYPQYTRPEVFRDRQVPEVLPFGASQEHRGLAAAAKPRKNKTFATRSVALAEG